MCSGGLIRIHRAESVPDVKIVNRDIGKVLFVKNEQPVVICGAGLLCITDAVDSQGQNALPFKQFRSRLN
jgi:methionyl-tRNA formyltransferase